ncbi:unnamed protein product [Pieris macdunnoughi]|uniref:Transposase n=1 Tax=Pieris macdunnoughi TaxID=345717 RepID=A0A821Y0I0_9NEOP|nr:unnamed protein product [Pieris macdunnoughi]
MEKYTNEQRLQILKIYYRNSDYVNGDRYRAMIIDYFWPELEYMDLDSMWFQQDGATNHTVHVTIDLMKNKFDERVISRNGPVDWPPRSCDLAPLDFFLWGYVNWKEQPFRPKCLAESRKIDRCTRARGGHMREVEFHS